MATKGIAELTAELYKLLEPLDSQNRTRLISATLTLLGESISSPLAGGSQTDGGIPDPAALSGFTSDALTFFNAKRPEGKSEELAVAARFRELKSDESTHEKDDFRNVFGSARRNFDSGNFGRDLGNARTRGFFNPGTGNTLSAYGINFVDALPDREAAKAITAPRGKKKKTGKSTAAKIAKSKTRKTK
jgi:hypothetical protein